MPESHEFSERQGDGWRNEILRWLCVLPASFVGAIAVHFLVGTLLQIAGIGGGSLRGGSNIAYWLGVVLNYVPQESAFVIAGALMAPRRQIATSIVLALLGLVFSLMTHVIGQHLAGNRVGIVNYLHLIAESFGLLVGAVFIFWYGRENRPTYTTR